MYRKKLQRNPILFVNIPMFFTPDLRQTFALSFFALFVHQEKKTQRKKIIHLCGCRTFWGPHKINAQLKEFCKDIFYPFVSPRGKVRKK